MTASEHEAMLTRTVCHAVLQLAGSAARPVAMPTEAAKGA
jgi:hypothetical protein